MDKIITGTKTFFTGFIAAVTSFLGVLAIPCVLLLGANIVDYITGMAAANFRKQEISSKISLQGIIKKLALWVLVLVGWGIDCLITYLIAQMGISLPLEGFVCALVVVWLLINEFISILENLLDIGVPMPPFLLKLAKYIKKQVEDKADVVEENVE